MQTETEAGPWIFTYIVEIFYISKQIPNAESISDRCTFVHSSQAHKKCFVNSYQFYAVFLNVKTCTVLFPLMLPM